MMVRDHINVDPSLERRNPTPNVDQQVILPINIYYRIVIAAMKNV